MMKVSLSISDKRRSREDECLICGQPLCYLDRDEQMICAVCGKTQPSKTRCVSGHFVCSECHMSGLGSITAVCLAQKSSDPVQVLKTLMALPFCHMHGPEHHVMVGAALLTAYKNAGGDIDLSQALKEMHSRGRQVPGGACGFWGACGAGISAGIYMAIVTGSTPLKNEAWGLSNRMTALALDEIGKVGGPRCCKRDSYLAIMQAAEFTRRQLGVEMQLSEIRCTHKEKNNQCIGSRCPFFVEVK